MYMNEHDKATLLIVDDDPDIREVLRLLLSGEGYAIREAASGLEALGRLDGADAILLDVMMPGMSGFEACGEIRKRSNAPILFLTARSREVDRVLGLKLGGDDYLCKPFSPSELSARVAALLRRYRVYQGKTERPGTQTIERCGLIINIGTGDVSRGGKRIPLTDLEQRLLLYLARRPGETIAAAELYAAVWREPYLLSSASTIMVHVRNLRKKLEADPKQPALIKTVWGKGYRVD
ncbi:MAG: response regulator transcription factor [Oscillospiraceae bacterium]|jgi:DNA-binding response OmpR family regulator|nr:response regulator transcription factor [Oscillospiraceae bacterium]